MPRLGWDMKVGSVAEWLKRDGDHVEAGEPICLIAGDKATTELEAPDSGILRLAQRSPELGDEVPVGTVLAYLVAPGENLPTATQGTLGTRGGEASGLSDDILPGGGFAAAAAAKAMSSQAETSGSRAIAAIGTGADRAVTEVGSPANGGRRIVASPRARRAAAARGLDWRTLVGSGRGGRILERDVRGVVADEELAGIDRVEPHVKENRFDMPVAGPERVDLAAPLRGIRRLTAKRMTASAQTVAAVTLTTEADATQLVRLREQALAERAASDTKNQRGDSDDVPAYADFIVKVVTLALVEHPALNASLTEQGIIQHASVHVAIAVDTPGGLIAPVIRDAATRSLASITSESSRLIAAARNGTCRAQDLEGATFTITNLGMFEIDAFTPMVNLPQCAILGIGRIIAKPVVVDEASEQVAVRRMLSLSLTFDHRLVDGAPAARFLQRIKHFVERPTLWLFR